MTDSHDIAQAARLRAELWRQVEEISLELEQAERRERRLSDWRHRTSRRLRTELYEAHHLIDALNRADPRVSAARLVESAYRPMAYGYNQASAATTSASVPVSSVG